MEFTVTIIIYLKGKAGGWLGGVLFDQTGSYQTIWITTILLSFVAAFSYFPIKERPINVLKTETQPTTTTNA